MEVTNELYNKDIIDTNQFDEIYDIYECSENLRIIVENLMIFKVKIFKILNFVL